MGKCLYCEEKLTGRVDKKYCTAYCKSAYHYQKNKAGEENLFKKIDTQLKTNRRLLKNHNKAGKSTIRRITLEKEGFLPKYFTHYWRAKNRNLYLSCYEYGFMETTENGVVKYVLVQWQPYMG